VGETISYSVSGNCGVAKKCCVFFEGFKINILGVVCNLVLIE